VNRHILPSHADVTAPDFSIFNQPARDKSCRVNADSETDALRRADHRSVYAHDFTS
jgi:hypothetical protein